MEEAHNRKQWLDLILKKIAIVDLNANYHIEQVYDILLGLIRALLYLKGYKSSGKGAHEAEVSYLGEIGFSYADVTFMDGLRQHRNNIKYEGRLYDVSYARIALDFMEHNNEKLQRIIRAML